MRNYPTVHKKRIGQANGWGPYSKKLAGIAHIAEEDKGTLMEFSVFPSQYRGMTQLPVEIYQSNYMPWFAKKDQSSYGYRFELEWKDQVYTDVSYTRLEDGTIAVKAEFVNRTELSQAAVLHYLIHRAVQEKKEITASGDGILLDALMYEELELKAKERRAGLNFDGTLTGEMAGEDYFHGHALSGLRGAFGMTGFFGQTEGDRVKYCMDRCPHAEETLYIHAKGNGVFALHGMSGESLKISGEKMEFYPVRITDRDSRELVLTCKEGTGVAIDCIILSRDMPRESDRGETVLPVLEEGKNRLILSYPDMEMGYGIVWDGEMSEVREFRTSRPETYLPYMTHNHVSKILTDDGKDEYVNIFIRPIFLEPGERRTLYGRLVCAHKDEIEARMEGLSVVETPDGREVTADNPYAFGQQLMQAVMLTNAVFPVRLQGNYIRHFTPGKWWDSLYTWDNGFIALGMTAINVDLAKECLDAYLTEPGNIHAAFVHHGSMVPVQAYVYKSIFEKTGDIDFLREYYPSMKQYYDFYSGHNPLSHMKQKTSGMLRPFDYFYNSGGWDDYPPQKYIMEKRMGSEVSPVINTCQAINFARIMAMAAQQLGEDPKPYREDIKEWKQALQTYAYDEESGYFSYLIHKDSEISILRTEDGENYNKGLDGAYPFMADACTAGQKSTLASYIMSEDHMWTPIGISVVDREASYYRPDGYWNGSVWMPHQWFVFLGMLEQGYAEYAVKIAETALNLWKKETDASYHCYEHFMVQSGRGAGWHNFSGLSAPVVLWYHGCFVEGTVTVPVNLLADRVVNDGKQMTIHLKAWEEKEDSTEISYIAAVPAGPVKEIFVNQVKVSYLTFQKAVLIPVPKEADSVVEIR